MAWGSNNGKCDCGRRIESGNESCVFCSGDMFRGLSEDMLHGLTPTPTDVYIAEELGWLDVDEEPEEAA